MFSVAASFMFTTMVMTSPTCDARWSLKKARDPERHSASDAAGGGWRAGIGMVSGRQAGSLVGSELGVIVGGRPISERRVSAPQPDSSRVRERRARVRREARCLLKVKDTPSP